MQHSVLDTEVNFSTAINWCLLYGKRRIIVGSFCARGILFLALTALAYLKTNILDWLVCNKGLKVK